MDDKKNSEPSSFGERLTDPDFGKYAEIDNSEAEGEPFDFSEEATAEARKLDSDHGK